MANCATTTRKPKMHPVVEITSSTSYRPSDNAHASTSKLAAIPAQQKLASLRNQAISPIPSKRKASLIKSASNSTISSSTLQVDWSDCPSLQRFADRIDTTLDQLYYERTTQGNLLLTNRTISYIRTVQPLNSPITALATTYLAQLAKLRVSAFPLTADKATLYLIYILPLAVPIARKVRKSGGELRARKNASPKSIEKVFVMLREIKTLSDPIWGIGEERSTLSAEYCGPLRDLVKGYGDSISDLATHIDPPQTTKRSLVDSPTFLVKRFKPFTRASFPPLRSVDSGYSASTSHAASHIDESLFEIKTEPDVDPVLPPAPQALIPAPPYPALSPIAAIAPVVETNPLVDVIALEEAPVAQQDARSLSPSKRDSTGRSRIMYGTKAAEERRESKSPGKDTPPAPTLLVPPETINNASQLSMIAVVDSSQIHRCDQVEESQERPTQAKEDSEKENQDPASSSAPVSSFLVPETLPSASFRPIPFSSYPTADDSQLSLDDPASSSTALQLRDDLCSPLMRSPAPLADQVEPLPILRTTAPSLTIRHHAPTQYRTKAKQQADAVRLRELLELMEDSSSNDGDALLVEALVDESA